MCPRKSDASQYAYSYNSPITHVDCQGTKPVDLSGLSCSELAKRIKEMAQRVFKRYIEILFDRFTLPWWPNGDPNGSVTGHITRFEGDREFLNRLIGTYQGKSNPCDNFRGSPPGQVPVAYRVMGHLSSPRPIGRPAPVAPNNGSAFTFRIDWGTVLKLAAVGGGAAAVGGALVFIRGGSMMMLK